MQRIIYVVLLAVAWVPFVSPLAWAETITFNVELSGAAEVPPVLSPGNGTLEALFDTDTGVLIWVIEYSGVAARLSAAHLHGPARIGDNAGLAIPIEGNLESPIRGEVVLSAAQAAELMEGLWYLNLHTMPHPSGELRGQLIPPE